MDCRAAAPHPPGTAPGRTRANLGNSTPSGTYGTYDDVVHPRCIGHGSDQRASRSAIRENHGVQHVIVVVAGAAVASGNTDAASSPPRPAHRSHDTLKPNYWSPQHLSTFDHTPLLSSLSNTTSFSLWSPARTHPSAPNTSAPSCAPASCSMRATPLTTARSRWSSWTPTRTGRSTRRSQCRRTSATTR